MNVCVIFIYTYNTYTCLVRCGYVCVCFDGIQDKMWCGKRRQAI